MTREEAVIILDGFKNNPLFNSTHARVFDMAISALTALEKIRAEIIQDVQNGVIQITKGSERLFEIIDKHIGGKDK